MRNAFPLLVFLAAASCGQGVESDSAMKSTSGVEHVDLLNGDASALYRLLGVEAVPRRAGFHKSITTNNLSISCHVPDQNLGPDPLCKVQFSNAPEELYHLNYTRRYANLVIRNARDAELLFNRLGIESTASEYPDGGSALSKRFSSGSGKFSLECFRGARNYMCTIRIDYLAH